MNLEKKLFKVSTYLAIASLWINLLAFPLTVMAQELEPDTVVETEQETEEEETEMTVEIVVNDNTAIVETETNADSNTGQNLIEESTTAEVETGDAGSETETDNLINLNQVDVGATLISPLETEVIIAIPKEIFNINTAEVENQATSSANTGANQIDIATQSAEIKTGDALAIANMVNVVNTNIVGSKINVYVTNKLDGEITEVLPTRK